MTADTDQAPHDDPAPPRDPAAPRGRGRFRWSRWATLGLAVVVGLGAFVVAWFQPHKLFVDDRVDQALPTARATTTSTGEDAAGGSGGAAGPAATTPVPAEPVDLASGDFVGLDHATQGTARVLELADGRRFLRFEGFETDNGPDLFVYLSTNPAGGPEGAFDDGFVDLGRLQGNVGDQNYELPADVDPAAYASVVVWCDRFDSAFGAADLVASPA